MTAIEVIIEMTTIPFIPVPTQTIKMGARAVFGKAFSTTRNGSKILASFSDHHKQIAINNPEQVPIIKPTIVSYNEIPRCLKISPFETY